MQRVYLISVDIHALWRAVVPLRDSVLLRFSVTAMSAVSVSFLPL